ncbi:right-handed parallel beta-helix repeat-containing protein [Pelagicoccus sp. NFK12]|uniref:Right-handed parallel beta-helix repeat-containing protein n=1 Tax=Pelagicoccus enzymogenes TaxID=2773457 RepID=A0A927F5U7_9BACT|nr:right-handed parallel beta-helix repeat-containing protein [Pelagicoccus enzymogenes]MBD5778958.1 right-handed parallel beta-helix repeat-containing protein [Pelagicoccus enzymogenes]
MALLVASSLGVDVAFAVDRAEDVLVLEIARNRDFREVQRTLEASDARSICIKIKSGSYRLRHSLHINRSNVSLVGEAGTVLRLAKNAQAPVISVGPLSEYPEEWERIENVTIANLVIDGNKDYQESEYNQQRPWIRNNGIDARTVTGLRVEGVICGNNRSGGLVVSWRCRDVVARTCVFENNYFDGVAYYDSVGVYTVDCDLRRNRGAGVSIDNAVSEALFANCRIVDNRDVGVFARHSDGLMFYKSLVKGSGNWAFFLSHDEKGKGVFNVEIASCEIVENNGGVRMGSVTAKQSAANRVVLSSFARNDLRGRGAISTAGAPLDRLEGGWNPVGNEGADLPDGPYSKRLYQALNTYDSLVAAPES